MNRPTLEVADIIRASGNSYFERHRSHLAWQHRKALDAIARCRTPALGGHRDQCSRCGHQAISYNSCRNRHCPKCQGNARTKWLAARSAELLPVPYFHIVFTLPHELSALVLQNKRLLYALLFSASAATMLEVAQDRKHLGADIGLLSVLHSWGQNLQHHPHIHSIVPAGGLTKDRSGWIAASPRFFLPVHVLSRVFRDKFAAGLNQLFDQDKLQFHGSLAGFAQAMASTVSPISSLTRTGSSTPSLLSAEQNMSSTTWLAILTALPSPTIVSSPYTTIESPSAGRTTLTAASRSS
jgi:Transposase zinc-binding domain/Putative transposase